MSERISVKTLVIMVLLLIGVVSIILSLFTTLSVRNQALESQEETLSKVIKVATTEVLLNIQSLGEEMRISVDKTPDLREILRDAIATPDNKELVSTLSGKLNEQYSQRIISAGYLKIFKLRLYSPDFKLIAQSTRDEGVAVGNMPANLLRAASKREGAERYKSLEGPWVSKDTPMLSYIAPLGGMRIIGYVEVVIDPTHNLQKVERMMQAPIRLSSPSGKPLWKSEAWEETMASNVLQVNYSIPSVDGGTAITITSLENVEALYDKIRNSLLFGGTIFLVVMLVAIYLSVMFLGRRLFGPIRGLMLSMQSCGQGDLTVKTDFDGVAEIQQLSNSLSILVSNLREQVAGIQENSSRVGTAAERLMQITHQTNRGMESQQGETHQLAASINEMVATVQEVARNAAHAATSAHTAEEQAATGKATIHQTVEAINRLADDIHNAAEVIQKLEHHSTTIGGVLDVIKDIADQTNLLALNAAIEAARAGEQGRGFAVVADEVRSLATRTQDSTQEIQRMIEQLQLGARNAVKVMEQSRERANVGVEQAANAGSALETITGAVSSINMQNEQIASATEEQGAVAEEINQNVVRIRGITDETSEAIHQTSISSEQLTELAVNLKQLVAKFKV